ncbi:hypothetical protein [Nocardiopsis listeri]|uniref:hypothetical protein n=1 Tax=Nocardiopsis listeri TaxID=53440 RepID=UPI000ADE6121|nr:hypothetical protein [Nocardiopsis listeri]
MKIAPNKAFVSDDGQWYYAMLGWKPLVPSPISKKPSMVQTAPIAGKASIETSSAGKKLAALVAEHGDLHKAEYMLDPQCAQAEQLGLRQIVRQYSSAEQVEEDLPRMVSAGWSAATQGQSAERTSTGRTVAGVVIGAVATGGLGAIAGGIIGASAKKAGLIQVTWER